MFSARLQYHLPLNFPAVVCTSTSTVGFPLESMISLAITPVTVTTLLDEPLLTALLEAAFRTVADANIASDY